MNWGYKIMVVYGVFVAAILFMVYRSSSTQMDLVTTDYYAKELVYQQRIDAAGRTAALSAPLSCTVKNGILQVNFPADFSGSELSGSAELYCPSAKEKDIVKEFVLKDAPLQLVLKPANKGLHELHVSWQTAGKAYYFETKLFL